MTTPLTAAPLTAISHITHGFFTREGGVSSGIYASLNCGLGSDDDKGAVSENRTRVASAMGVSATHLLTVHQIHSPDVVHVTDTWTPETAPKADAMVTDRTGIALGVLAADCTPVLFADTQKKIIGAAHAGWKGAFTGVLEATIDAMVKLGATRANIVAAIGPCISRNAYEVGPEFRDRFLDASADNAQWFTPSAREDHFMFDLTAYAAARLETAGIGTVTRLNTCTYADESKFFSYRRTTHRGEPDYGRQMSVIALKQTAP
ncbi:MAG: peptidoglycan editing factor PgeF [Parvibaculum sp.]|nr:peptidoglycan editing factor PgeF [Parvibaculum sp.]